MASGSVRCWKLTASWDTFSYWEILVNLHKEMWQKWFISSVSYNSIYRKQRKGLCQQCWQRCIGLSCSLLLSFSLAHLSFYGCLWSIPYSKVNDLCSMQFMRFSQAKITSDRVIFNLSTFIYNIKIQHRLGNQMAYVQISTLLLTNQATGRVP